MDGYGGTTIRAIAADADVSPALVLHHFESKDGLVDACDRYVVETIRTVKGEAIVEGTISDPGFVAGSFRIAPPIMRYLGWSLARGTAATARLFDEMLEESIRLFALAEQHGLVKTTDDPRARAAIVLTMQLGSVVLHDHLSRALGENVFSPEGLMTLSRLSMEVFTRGLFNEDAATDTTTALVVAAETLRKEASDG